MWAYLYHCCTVIGAGRHTASGTLVGTPSGLVVISTARSRVPTRTGSEARHAGGGTTAATTRVSATAPGGIANTDGGLTSAETREHKDCAWDETTTGGAPSSTAGGSAPGRRDGEITTGPPECPWRPT